MEESKCKRCGFVHGKCHAHSSRTGNPCKLPPMLGQKVCRKHGGAAPQCRAKAAKRLELAMITPDRVLLELARVAFSDVASFFNPDGTIKKPADLDEDQRAVLAGFEASIQNVSAADGKQDLIHKFKAWDKVKALELLAKHFGLTTEKVEHQGEIKITWADPE